MEPINFLDLIIYGQPVDRTRNQLKLSLFDVLNDDLRKLKLNIFFLLWEILNLSKIDRGELVLEKKDINVCTGNYYKILSTSNFLNSNFIFYNNFFWNSLLNLYLINLINTYKLDSLYLEPVIETRKLLTGHYILEIVNELPCLRSFFEENGIDLDGLESLEDSDVEKYEKIFFEN